MKALYGLTTMLNICNKAKKDIKKAIQILLARKKTKWKAMQDLS